MVWKEVTQEEFYKVIGPKNVHPVPIGNWPYISEFRTPNGDVIGKTIPHFPVHPNLPENSFWILYES